MGTAHHVSFLSAVAFNQQHYPVGEYIRHHFSHCFLRGTLNDLQSVAVTLNAQLLKAPLHTLQCISILGYSLFPLTLSTLLLTIPCPMLVKICVVAVGFLWSCKGAIAYVAGVVKKERKLLACYPIVLFYLQLAWFVVLI
mgnify:CR=1 FL=1